MATQRELINIIGKFHPQQDEMLRSMLMESIEDIAPNILKFGRNVGFSSAGDLPALSVILASSAPEAGPLANAVSQMMQAPFELGNPLTLEAPEKVARMPFTMRNLPIRATGAGASFGGDLAASAGFMPLEVMSRISNNIREPFGSPIDARNKLIDDLLETLIGPNFMDKLDEQNTMRVLDEAEKLIKDRGMDPTMARMRAAKDLSKAHIGPQLKNLPMSALSLDDVGGILLPHMRINMDALGTDVPSFSQFAKMVKEDPVGTRQLVGAIDEMGRSTMEFVDDQTVANELRARRGARVRSSVPFVKKDLFRYIVDHELGHARDHVRTGNLVDSADSNARRLYHITETDYKKGVQPLRRLSEARADLTAVRRAAEKGLPIPLDIMERAVQAAEIPYDDYVNQVNRGFMYPYRDRLNMIKKFFPNRIPVSRLGLLSALTIGLLGAGAAAAGGDSDSA